MNPSTPAAVMAARRWPAPVGAAPGLLVAWLQRRTIRGQILLVSLAVLAPILAALGNLAYRVEQMRAAALAVNDTGEAIRHGNRLLRLFAEMQLGVRGYALSGDQIFLDAYRRTRAQWPEAVQAAARLVAADPRQTERLSAVARDTDEFFKNWEERLPVLRPGGDDQTAWMRIGEDEGRMRRIAATIGDFVAHEQVGVRERLRHEERARRQVYLGAVASVLLAVGLLAAFGVILGRSIAQPIQRVSDAAHRLGGGQWDERVRPDGSPETRALATAFNEMADALQQARASLGARNRELEQLSARLAAANDDLRERQRETDDFVYVLSHDLRAPLINIQGFGKRLAASMAALETHLTGPTASLEALELLGRMAESLRYVNLGTAKIEQLIARLLEITRLATRPGQFEPIESGNLVREVVGACRFQLEERGIEVSIGRLPPVFGDPVQLNQVFTNLIDNAIKYMGERPRKRIEVTCAAQGDRYCFAVRDTGRGIDPKDREKVFRMFARLAPGSSPGEGIGLAAVRAIINRHGGRIWVEGAAGGGSTFYFTLPRPPADAPAAVQTAAAASAGTAGREENHADAHGTLH